MMLHTFVKTNIIQVLKLSLKNIVLVISITSDL